MQLRSWRNISSLDREFWKLDSFAEGWKLKKKRSCLFTNPQLIRVKFLKKWETSSRNSLLKNTKNSSTSTISSKGLIRYYLIALPSRSKRKPSARITKCWNHCSSNISMEFHSTIRFWEPTTHFLLLTTAYRLRNNPSKKPMAQQLFRLTSSIPTTSTNLAEWLHNASNDTSYDD